MGARSLIPGGALSPNAIPFADIREPEASVTGSALPPGEAIARRCQLVACTVSRTCWGSWAVSSGFTGLASPIIRAFALSFAASTMSRTLQKIRATLASQLVALSALPASIAHAISVETHS